MNQNYATMWKGSSVFIDEDVFIEWPNRMEVGDRVRFLHGFEMRGKPQMCRIDNDVTFYPGCYIQGSPIRFIVDHHVEFHPGTYISMGRTERSILEIGNHTHFAAGCALYAHGGLLIGEHCNIGPHVVLATVGHDASVVNKPMSETREYGPIVLEDDVWIGANATVLPGVTMGKGSVLGAGAVLTHDTQPGWVYVGVPALPRRAR